MINKNLQVIGICGSLREQSYNKKLIQMASLLLPEGTIFSNRGKIVTKKDVNTIG